MPFPFSSFTPSKEFSQDEAREQYRSSATDDEVTVECTYTGGNTLRVVAGGGEGGAYIFLDDSAGGAYFATDEDAGSLYQMIVSELKRRQWSVNPDPRSPEHFSCDVDAFAEEVNERYGLAVEATA